MQTRTRNALVFTAALSAIVAAVVWISRTSEPKKPPATAIDAVPEGALLVAKADLEPMRRSGLLAPLLTEAREIPGLGKVREVCGFDPMEGLTELVVAVPAAGSDGAFGLVGAGIVNRDALIACASKVIEARGGRAVVNTIGSFRTVRDAGAQSDAEIAARENGPVLLGAGRYLRSMIDTAEGQIPSVRKDEAHGRLSQELGPSALRVTVVFSDEQKRLLAEELSRTDTKTSPAASVVGLGLGVALGERISLHALIACDRAEPCADLSKIFDARRKAQLDDTLMRLLGLGPVLERLTIAPEGPRVHGRVELSNPEATSLIERILVVRAAARQAEQERDKPFEQQAPAPSASSSPSSSSSQTGPQPSSAPQVEKKTKPDAGAR